MKGTLKIAGILVSVLAVAGGIYYWYSNREPPRRFVTQGIRRGDVVQVVNATGTVQPVLSSPVGAQVSGIVWKLHADFNDPVKKGQVLVELNPDLFRTAVERERANLAGAVADVAKAKADLLDAHRIAERATQLAEKNYIPLQERDTALAKEMSAKAGLQGAEARVMQQRAVLQNAELNMKNSVILSPVDGVVIARNVELGQAVVASFQAPNLFTIADDLRKMQVLANVDEADIGLLKEGQVAQFTVDAFRSRRYTGTVAQVRNAAQTVQNVVTYVVVLNVENPDLSLRPGMTANVRLEAARRDNVLLLPNVALRFKPPLELMKSGGAQALASGADGGGRRHRPDGGVSEGSAGGAGGVGGERRWRGGRHRPDGGAPDGGAPGGGGPGAGGPGGPGAGGPGGPGAGGPGAGGPGGPGGGGRGQKEGRATVWVQDGPARLRQVAVATGITDGMQTELLSGLAEGDEVVTDLVKPASSSGPSGAPPGMPPGGAMQQRGAFRRGGM